MFKCLFVRFQPDRGFSGADQAPTRDGPVQFEKDTEEDPFGLNKFLTEAKKAKRPAADRYIHCTALTECAGSIYTRACSYRHCTYVCVVYRSQIYVYTMLSISSGILGLDEPKSQSSDISGKIPPTTNIHGPFISRIIKLL